MRKFVHHLRVDENLYITGYAYRCFAEGADIGVFAEGADIGALLRVL